jgi:hypothetical protein
VKNTLFLDLLECSSNESITIRALPDAVEAPMAADLGTGSCQT